MIDYYNIPVTQEEVDFAIPFLDENIPLYIDPFLLWKSPSQQDNSLHLTLINSFNALCNAYIRSQNGTKNDKMQELAKKKPDTPLNTYKVKLINRVLEPIKELLQYEDTAPFLDILIADDMPTNSDVVLIMSQYIRAMNFYKEKYYSYAKKRMACTIIMVIF